MESKQLKHLTANNFKHKQYSAYVASAAKNAAKYGIFSALSIGFLNLVMFLSYSLAFWYGAKLVR